MSFKDVADQDEQKLGCQNQKPGVGRGHPALSGDCRHSRRCQALLALPAANMWTTAPMSLSLSSDDRLLTEGSSEVQAEK